MLSDHADSCGSNDVRDTEKLNIPACGCVSILNRGLIIFPGDRPYETHKIRTDDGCCGRADDRLRKS